MKMNKAGDDGGDGSVRASNVRVNFILESF